MAVEEARAPEAAGEGEAWYARAEPAGPWRISACLRHGRELERHRFRWLGATAEFPGPSVRSAGRCAICSRPALLAEVERCTCEFDSARCPEHQNLGCGG